MAELAVKNDPTGVRGVYLHSIANVVGTVAEQTFMSVMNPASSGRFMTLGTVAISSANTSPTTETTPLRGWRIGAASGGSLVAASSVAKFSSLYPNSTAEVRVGNPTITKVDALFNSPPLVDNRSSVVHTVEIPPGATFLLRPGEGIALNITADVVSRSWNLTIVWVELH